MDTPTTAEVRDLAGRFHSGVTGNARGRPRQDPTEAAFAALLTRARATGAKVTLVIDLPRAA